MNATSQVVTLDYKGLKQDAIVCRGFVLVATPVYDCEGTQRTIDFPRVGKQLGKPVYHWTVAQYVDKAREVARRAIAEAK